MPTSTIVIVSGIVAAFALFGFVLAWGDRQTRNLVRHDTAAGKDSGHEEFKKAA